MKQPDGRDTCGSCLDARLRVLNRHASQRQHWNALLAGLSQPLEALRLRVFLFEDRGKDCQVCTFGGCLLYFLW